MCLHWKDKENKADIVFCMEQLPVGDLSVGFSRKCWISNLYTCVLAVVCGE